MATANKASSETTNIYLFRREDNGEIVEREWTRREFYDWLNGTDDFSIILPDGAMAVRDRDEELSRKQLAMQSPQTSRAYNMPLESLGAAVRPHQAAKFNEDAKRDGNTGVFYDPQTGMAHFSSRKSRNQELRRRNMFDKDGGYGDHSEPPRY